MRVCMQIHDVKSVTIGAPIHLGRNRPDPSVSRDITVICRDGRGHTRELVLELFGVHGGVDTPDVDSEGAPPIPVTVE